MKKQPSERWYIKDQSNYYIYIIAHIPKKNQCIKFRTFHGTQRKFNIKKAIYAQHTILDLFVNHDISECFFSAESSI